MSNKLYPQSSNSLKLCVSILVTMNCEVVALLEKGNRKNLSFGVVLQAF